MRGSDEGLLGRETKRFNQHSPLRSQTLVSYFEKPTAFQAWSKLCYYFLGILKPPPAQVQWTKVLPPCQRLEEGRDERQSRDRDASCVVWASPFIRLPSLGKGWPQGLLNHNDQGLTSKSEGRRLTPLLQPRQAQHAPLSEHFHPPTPSRKAPHKIPANAAHHEGQSFTCNRVRAKFSQVEGEQLFKNCLFFFFFKVHE